MEVQLASIRYMLMVSQIFVFSLHLWYQIQQAITLYRCVRISHWENNYIPVISEYD
jgi:hypothetical protein